MVSLKTLKRMPGSWLEQHGPRVRDWPWSQRIWLPLLWCLPRFRQQWRRALEAEVALANRYQQLPPLAVSDDLRRRLHAIAQQPQLPPPRQASWCRWSYRGAALASVGLGLVIGFSGGNTQWMIAVEGDTAGQDSLDSPSQYVFSSYDVGDWLREDEL